MPYAYAPKVKPFYSGLSRIPRRVWDAPLPPKMDAGLKELMRLHGVDHLVSQTRSLQYLNISKHATPRKLLRAVGFTLKSVRAMLAKQAAARETKAELDWSETIVALEKLQKQLLVFFSNQSVVQQLARYKETVQREDAAYYAQNVLNRPLNLPRPL